LRHLNLKKSKNKIISELRLCYNLKKSKEDEITIIVKRLEAPM